MSLSFYLSQKEKYRDEAHKKCISDSILRHFNEAISCLKDPFCSEKRYEINLFSFPFCGKKGDNELIFKGVQEKLGDLKDYVVLNDFN